MRLLWVAAMLGMAGCVAPVAYPGMPTQAPPTLSLPEAHVQRGQLPARQAAENFLAVVARVEPVAETYCRQARRVSNCDFRIVIDDRPGQQANAYQTTDRAGRPIIAFTLALIADARNQDEIAFTLGHEAAHHIAGHLPQQQETAVAGAVMAGVIAAASGANEADIEQAQQLGAGLAARGFSKEFELQADAMGAEIAYRAGFDPIRGAGFFDHLPDPGDRFLGSHPANRQRKAVVAEVVARLRGQ